MGFSPREVDQMSMWQFMAAAEGYTKANTPDDDKSLSKTEQDDLWAMVQHKMGRA